VGHVHLTDKNYAKFKKEVMKSSKVFILGASDSSCDTCCFTEALLDSLKENFDSKKYTAKVSLQFN
jgi:alpha-L-arabinofuranosidase